MAQSSKINLSLDYRYIVGALVLIILVMLAVWRPWEVRYDKDARTVSVTGEATVKAVPDEYAFYPNYTFSNADKTIALSDANAKATEVVTGLKKLSVDDKSIKSSVNGYPDYSPEDNESYSYAATIVVTVGDKDLAQKVQDYLVTTSPEGSVTPQPTFSDTKRKELENTAREEATKDARKKADQLAENLKFRLAGVKTVTDGAGFGGIEPLYSRLEAGSSDMVANSPSLVLQPGENDLQYSVTVVHFIR
ncbi:MAG: SIMPL domain-containing protein [Candidatus Saccharimonadales bacterium]